MEKQNPGIWIGTAIAVAVLAVAISIPPAPKSPAAPSAPAKPTASATPAPHAEPVVVPAGIATAIAATAPENASSPPKPAIPVRDPDDPPPPPKPDLPPATRKNVVQAIGDLDLIIRDFRTSLGGNPVGDNAEITAALLGNNLKQLKLRLPDTSQLNAAGELCDLWGTPYFFHQLSGTQMEIRSAGPDRKMWTGDDIQD